MDKDELTKLITELHQRYGALVERKCQAILSNAEAARDAAQEVFIRLMNHYQLFLQEACPIGWLYRTCTNVCIDELRRRRRRNDLALTKEMEQVLASTSPSAEAVLGSREELRRLIKRLDRRTLQILIYHYLDGMTQEEIATTMGLSRKTVWSKLQYLRRLQIGYS